MRNGPEVCTEVGSQVVIATYTKGRWSVFISPTAALHVPLAPMDGDAEHMVTIICPGHETLSKQRMIGWNPESMWDGAVKYVDERDADDEKDEDDDEG
jgi:hypothetical protein